MTVTASRLLPVRAAGAVTADRSQSQRVSLPVTAVTAVTASERASCACVRARARARVHARARVERTGSGNSGNSGNRYELICSSIYNHSGLVAEQLLPLCYRFAAGTTEAVTAHG